MRSLRAEVERLRRVVAASEPVTFCVHESSGESVGECRCKPGDPVVNLKWPEAL
jgi:hypothetical protein